MDCIAIVPARFASTRFPGKLLADLAGQPLIAHVVAGVRAIPGIEATVVATDDRRIAEAAEAAGAEVAMTSGDYASGTDRVAEVAERYPADTIVNVQGDELIVDADAFATALSRFRSAEADYGTLRAKLSDPADFWDPNVVKLVIDARERALYFSRSPLPFPRRRWEEALAEGAAPKGDGGIELAAAERTMAERAWAHLGVYFYRREALQRWAQRPPSPLEIEEGLEQLRMLEAGEAMYTYPIADTVPGVNTPADLERARAALASRASRV